MRKQISKLTRGSLVAGLLVVGLSTGVTAFASSADTGASGALADNDYTLNEMLVYAMEDEHLAQAEYDAIMDEYGVQRPFSNIINAEAYHISLLEPLFEEYGVDLPDEDWGSIIIVPDTIEEAYSAGIEAEEKNIAMYEEFLDEDIPEDVKDVFEKLKDASERHLAAFERSADGTGCNGGACDRSAYGNGYGLTDETGSKSQRGKANGGTGGGNHARGDRGASQGSCIYNN